MSPTKGDIDADGDLLAAYRVYEISFNRSEADSWIFNTESRVVDTSGLSGNCEILACAPCASR